MKKSINSLTPKDFQTKPIWQPVDDLEDPDMEVTPYAEETIHLEEMYLVATEFRFADGSEWDGYVRFSWGKPQEMALAINDQEFLFFSGDRLGETEERHERFAQEFGKEEDAVFPIEYHTKMKLYIQNVVY